MASTVDDIFTAIRPLWALEKRIQHHLTGGLLVGMKYDRFGKVEVKGVRDLPVLQPVGVLEEENQAIGGGASPHAMGSGSKADVYVVRYMIQTRVEYGLFRLDPVTDTTTLGMCEWMARLRDALETNEAGTIDPLLDKLLVRPMQFAVEDSGHDQLAWASILRVTLTTRLYYPGGRSCIQRGVLAN